MTKNFIIVAILATLALSCQEKTEKNETAAAPDNEKILKRISSSKDSAGFTIGGLPKAEADSMVRNYKKVAGTIHNDPSKQNTRSVWFRLEDLTKLIEILNAEKKALQKGDTTRKDSVTDGVRIYFGRYTKKLKHPERNTLVFVSTRWIKKGNFHGDYFHNVEMIEPSNKGINVEPFNNGELSPPNNLGVSFDSHID